MKVCEIMTKNPACCTPKTSLVEVARMMVTNDCGSIPVCEEGNSGHVIGVITDRDIVVRAVAASRNPLTMHVEDCMSRPVAVISAESDVRVAVRTLEENQVRRAPVVDDKGALVGLVAQA